MHEACNPANLAASLVTTFFGAIHVNAGYVVDVWEYDLTKMHAAIM